MGLEVPDGDGAEDCGAGGLSGLEECELIEVDRRRGAGRPPMLNRPEALNALS